MSSSINNRSVEVSLTTTNKRLVLCRSAILSLLTQSFIPSKIILNISKEPYLRDEGVKDCDIFSILTNGLSSSLKSLVEIRWVKNTGPYRKLIPTLIDAGQNDIVVTADDDIFYGEYWLEKLLNDFEPDKRIIHAGRVRYQQRNKFNKLAGYMYWPIITKPEQLTDDWIVTYGGGAVLCRGWFSDDLIEDSSYLKVAPTADDLWYSKICKLSGLKVKVIPEALEELNFFQHEDGLVNHNFPRVNRFIGKLKHRFVDMPLNYYRLVRFGNDIAYDSIEKYFSNKV